MKLLNKGVSDGGPKSKSDEKAQKQIDLRKGISIEKKIRMDGSSNG